MPKSTHQARRRAIGGEFINENTTKANSVAKPVTPANSGRGKRIPTANTTAAAVTMANSPTSENRCSDSLLGHIDSLIHFTSAGDKLGFADCIEALADDSDAIGKTSS